MTNLYNGLLADLFQNDLRSNPEVLAISYAVQQEKRRIIDEAKTTRTMAVIDELPEDVLDILAVELRSPYYNEGASIQEKRTLIKKSLTWSGKAGTPAAVTEMMAVLFGDGGVEEWFNFDPLDGPIVPGTFDLFTGGAITDPDDYANFMIEMNRIIERIKNARSHLRRIMFLRAVNVRPSGATLPQSHPVVMVTNTMAAERQTSVSGFAASEPEQYGEVYIRN